MDQIIITKIPDRENAYSVTVNGKEIAEGMKDITIRLQAGKPCEISTHSEFTFGTLIKAAVSAAVR